MSELKNRASCELQIIVTGSHLSAEHGNTVHEILQEGFVPNWRVENIVGVDVSIDIAKSHGRATAGVAKALENLRPDLVVVLGDRYEIHAAAVAALIVGVPIVHIHGGELTEGAIDDEFRHSITKMSRVHLVSHEVYAKRVRQMGAHPDSVFVVGGLGFESVNRTEKLSKEELELLLGCTLSDHNLLVVFHPETAERDNGVATLQNLLGELKKLNGVKLLFSMPNADAGNRDLAATIDDFARQHENASTFVSIGAAAYVSLFQFCDAIVGNSSSGLLEAPGAGIPTLNVGSRQRGRITPSSVVSCLGDRKSIATGLEQVLDPTFLARTREFADLYSGNKASVAISDALERVLKGLPPRQFNDLL